MLTNQALCIWLITPINPDYTFLGSVCKFFFSRIHHNGESAWLQWKKATNVIPKDTTTHWQFGNQQLFDHPVPDILTRLSPPLVRYDIVCSTIRCQRDTFRLRLTGSTADCAQPQRGYGLLTLLLVPDISHLWLRD